MLVFFIYLKSMQPITITVKKSTGGFRFDYLDIYLSIYLTGGYLYVSLSVSFNADFKRHTHCHINFSGLSTFLFA